jgi:hypothetical protein
VDEPLLASKSGFAASNCFDTASVSAGHGEEGGTTRKKHRAAWLQCAVIRGGRTSLCRGVAASLINDPVWIHELELVLAS